MNQWPNINFFGVCVKAIDISVADPDPILQNLHLINHFGVEKLA
jgi:hypothetical protein